MIILPKWVKPAGYGALHIIQFVTACIVTFAIHEQAQYAPPKICILFITNYHLEDSQYIFEAKSGACGGIIGIGSLGMALAVILFGISMAYHTRQKLRAPRVILMLASIATMFAFVSLVGASLASAGLRQTCSQFESVSGYSCEDVFEAGFFYDGKVNHTFVQSLATIAAACGAAWVMFLSWVVYAGLEWYNHKHEAERWW
ncbi:hypothetical protein HK104_003383 [Borealophlyctis nickersoniae]|nr:hypothetical protein HK104_003383 [Borealophlyctis nickersoniae]